MTTRNTCSRDNYLVVVQSKVNPAYDICRCLDCGVTGHREPVFDYKREPR